MAPQATLIFDANATNVGYEYGRYIEDKIWYGGSALTSGSLLQDLFTFGMRFEGTEIAFYGCTFGQGNLTFATTIDEEVSGLLRPSDDRNITKWYQSPSLSDSVHTIQTVVWSLTLVDYFLVTAGSSTNLTSATLIVDDVADDEIWYTGSWRTESSASYELAALKNVSAGNTSISARPHDHTLHIANHVGDSFEFHFSGHSISVYGVLNPLDSVTLEFRLDGGVITHNIHPSDEDRDHQGVLLNHQFYQNTTLSSGNHTLVVNVTALGGSPDSDGFQLDYITYKPSFSFVNEKPTFQRGIADLKPTVSQATDNEPHPSLPIRAIIGGVIGFIAILLAAWLLLYCRTKVTKKRTKDQTDAGVEPFTLHHSIDSKPRPSKWKELFPSQGSGSGTNQVYSVTPLSSSSQIPLIPLEAQERNDELVFSPSMPPSRVGDLYARIQLLTQENERLARENAPPEYGGSDVDLRRSDSYSVLPSYRNLNEIQ